MTFVDAIKSGFSNYASFSGKASRPEFWWFYLFLLIGGIVASWISPILYLVFALGTIVPSFAVGARRLHDTNRSGWWQLLLLIPLIGFIVLVVFWAQKGQSD